MYPNRADCILLPQWNAYTVSVTQMIWSDEASLPNNDHTDTLTTSAGITTGHCQDEMKESAVDFPLQADVRVQTNQAKGNHFSPQQFAL